MQLRSEMEQTFGGETRPKVPKVAGRWFVGAFKAAVVCCFTPCYSTPARCTCKSCHDVRAQNNEAKQNEPKRSEKKCDVSLIVAFVCFGDLVIPSQVVSKKLGDVFPQGLDLLSIVYASVV